MNKNEGSRYNYYYLISLVSSILIGSLQFGYALCCLNPICDIMIALYGWKNGPNDLEASIYIGIITFLIPFGATFTCLTCEHFAQKGRRNALFFSNVFLIFGSLLTLIFNKYFLILGRLIIGLTAGICATLPPMMIREYAPVSISGLLLCFHQVIIVLGSLLPMIISIWKPPAAFFLQTQFWRLIFSFFIIFSIIQILLFWLVFIYDTPRFLIQSNKDELCIESLHKIYINEPEVNKVYNEVKNLIKEESSTSGVPISKLFSSDYRYALLVGSLVSFFQVATGIDLLTFYSSRIFNEGGHSEKTPNILLNFLGFIFTIFAALIVDKLGRKPLLVWGTFFCAICTFLIGFLYKNESEAKYISSFSYYFMVFIVLSYFCAFNLTIGPVCWIYMAEILPPSGLSVTSAINLFSCFTLGLISPLLITLFGGNTFFIFGIFNLICTIFCYFCALETKGKTELEIKKLFENSSNNSQEKLLN